MTSSNCMAPAVEILLMEDDESPILVVWINTLTTEHKSHHLADSIVTYIFLHEMVVI